MRIHADELRMNQLYAAARVAGVSIEHFSGHGSRKRRYAFEVALSGSSLYNGASSQVEWPYKAATWDEWGVFLHELFKVEPGIVAGPYKGVEDFMRQTREFVESASRYEQVVGRKRVGVTGPWLTA